jgi:hypothetical protein
MALLFHKFSTPWVAGSNPAGIAIRLLQKGGLSAILCGKRWTIRDPTALSTITTSPLKEGSKMLRPGPILFLAQAKPDEHLFVEGYW